MKAAVKKSSSLDSSLKKRMGNKHALKHTPNSSLALPVSNTYIQRKPTCVCGGGCPRYQTPFPIQAKLKIGQPGNMHEQKSEAFSPIRIIRGNWHSVPTIQLQHSQRCSLGSNESKVATWITRQKVPRTHYGASYNHKFDAIPTGCSLKGVQISETVSAQRDDFQTGTKDIPVGVNIWKLTARNELHRPDDIWTPVGPKGIGANPLLNWPAVLDQNQIWYYRYSSKDRWRGSGPGFIIKVTLHGNVRKRNTLKVTTTDHGVSRTEPYRGPKIRLRKRRRR